MATEIEVDVALEAFLHVPAGGREAMTAALEAAERVRPRKISTERTRRHRAKKRAGNVPPNGNVPANVPSNAPWNVPRDVTGARDAFELVAAPGQPPLRDRSKSPRKRSIKDEFHDLGWRAGASERPGSAPRPAPRSSSRPQPQGARR